MIFGFQVSISEVVSAFDRVWGETAVPAVCRKTTLAVGRLEIVGVTRCVLSCMETIGGVERVEVCTGLSSNYAHEWARLLEALEGDDRIRRPVCPHPISPMGMPRLGWV